MKKPFTIYRQAKVTERDHVWIAHRRYATIEAMGDGLRDLTKTPRKMRYYLYLPMPTVDPEAMAIEFKDDMRIHAK